MKRSPSPPGAIALAFSLFFARSVPAEPVLHLQTDPAAGDLQFEVTGDETPGYWLLQHSPDFSTWSDLVFLENPGSGRLLPGTELPSGALPRPVAKSGFFRTVFVEQDNPRLRELLDQQIKWRLAGIDDYQLDFQSMSGRWLMQDTVTVVAGEVVSGPEDGAIDELFDRLAAALATDPFGYSVTWDPVLGYPVQVSIDPDESIADEEYGWTILSLTSTESRLEALVEQRAKWELAGVDDYQYEIARWAGWGSLWRGFITVVDGEVVARETLETGGLGTPTGDTIPSIDGLFDRLSEILAEGPYGYNVVWDPVLGYPAQVSIDPEAWMADDESGWTIHSLTPITDPRKAELLVQRAKWRSFGHHDYSFTCHRENGGSSWSGIITVVADQVVARQTIASSPAGQGGTDVPAIDGLFDRLLAALASHPFDYRVTWDPVLGYPAQVFIDPSQLIIDEETRWTLTDFTPAP